jgi:TonB family protein
MRNISVIALFGLMAAGSSGGQQITQAVTDLQSDTHPAPVKVYAIGPGVTAPELLPLDLGPFPTEKCREKVDGKVALTLLVDTEGKPHNIMFLHPLGTNLDKLALKIVEADQFKPGTHDGAPVVIGESVEVEMHACAEQTKEDLANKSYRLRLRSQPVQNFEVLPQPMEEAVLAPNDIEQKKSKDGSPVQFKVGGKVSPPVVLNNVEAEFSDAARQAKYQGTCLIALTVDRNGLPQNLHVVKSLDYGLTEKAIESVRKYRFKPAMRNGVPVPVLINVQVEFRIFN